MKITLDKDVFLEKILLASKFTSNRLSSITSLQGIMIEGKEKDIDIYSTNLNSYFHTKMKSQNTKPFKIVFEPKKVAEFLSLLPAGTVEFEIDDKKITITKDKTKGSFPLIKADDFPLPPQIKEKEQKIKTDFLLKNLPLVLFSSSQDDSRPVLTGINFIVQDDDFVIVATDGFRLSLVRVKKEVDFPQMLVPRDFLDEVVRFIKDEKEIGMVFSKIEKVISFTVGENTFFSRLIDGEFPPFERVIPAEYKTRVVLDKEELLRNVRLISVFARDFSNIVIFHLGKEGLRLSPKTEEEEQSITFQEAKVEGEEQKIAFNFKFVIDLLNHLNAKKVVVEVLRPDAPAVFRIEDNKNFLHIVMPVRIQS